MVSGTTQVVAVIGHPIAQVKSPDNFNRYFAEQHMDSVMIPVDIAPDAVAAYLNALRGWQNMTGVLVTVLVMNGGHKAMLEETKTVFSRGPELEQMGLRVPQITKIMQELKAMGCPVDPATLTVDDALKQLIPFLKRKEEAQ